MKNTIKANTIVIAILPVTFAPPGKIGIKPIKLLMKMKKNIVNKKGKYLSYLAPIDGFATSSRKKTIKGSTNDCNPVGACPTRRVYVFATDKKFSKKITSQFSFGGGCINDTVIQFNNKRLPFGGVGHSGYGAYHGKYSIDTFLHHKSMVHKGNWLDLPMRYAPYKNKLAGIRKMLRWL
jgi:hypothetical protein